MPKTDVSISLVDQTELAQCVGQQALLYVVRRAVVLHVEPALVRS